MRFTGSVPSPSRIWPSRRCQPNWNLAGPIADIAVLCARNAFGRCYCLYNNGLRPFAAALRMTMLQCDNIGGREGDATSSEVIGGCGAEMARRAKRTIARKCLAGGGSEAGPKAAGIKNMAVNDATASEAARHQSAVEALARETGTEPGRVRQLYDAALARLEANAKVRGYLSVLAGRNVRSSILKAREATSR